MNDERPGDNPESSGERTRGILEGLRDFGRRLRGVEPLSLRDDSRAGGADDSVHAHREPADETSPPRETGEVDVEWVFESEPDVPARIHALRRRVGLPPGEWFDQFWFEAARADYRMRRAGNPEFVPIIFTAPANLGKSTIINSLVGTYISAESWTGGSTKRLVAIFHSAHAADPAYLEQIYSSYKLLEDPAEAIHDGDEVLVAFNDGVPGNSVVLYDIPGNNIDGLTIANRKACAQAILHVIVTNATFYNDEYQRELLQKIVSAGGTKQSVIIYRSDPSISPHVIREHSRAIATLLYPDASLGEDEIPPDVLGIYSVDPVPWQQAEQARERGEVLPISIDPIDPRYPPLHEILHSLDKRAVEIKREKTRGDWQLLATSLGSQLEEVRRQSRYLELVRAVLERIRAQAAAGAIEALLADGGSRLLPTLRQVWTRAAPRALAVARRVSSRLSRPIHYLTEGFRRFLRPGEDDANERPRTDLPQALIEDYRRDLQRETRHLRSALRSDGVTLVRNDALFGQSGENARVWNQASEFTRAHGSNSDEYPRVFEDRIEVRFPDPVAGRVPDDRSTEIAEEIDTLLDDLQRNFAKRLANALRESGFATQFFARTSIWPLMINALSFVGLCTIAWDLELSLWPDIPVAAIVLLINPRLERLADVSLRRSFRPILVDWFHQNFHARLSTLYGDAVVRPYEDALAKLAIDENELARLERAIEILRRPDEEYGPRGEGS